MKKKLIVGLAVLISIFVLLEAGLRLAGPVLVCPKEKSEAGSAGERAPYRILCIGESTTDGEYPRFLAEALRAQDKTREYIVIDEGHGRATTDYLLAELEDNLALYQPHMIIAMMGNDDYSDEVVYERMTRQKALNAIKTYRLLTILGERLQGRVSAMVFRTKDHRSKEGLQRKELSEQEKDLFRQGNRFFDEKDYEKAQGYFRKMLEIRPSDAAYIGVARSATRARRYTEAIHACEKAIEVNPSNEEIYVELGLCYREMEEKERKNEGAMYLKALEIDPHSKKAYKYLTLYYFLNKKFAEYNAARKKALSLKIGELEEKKNGILAALFRGMEQDDVAIREKKVGGERGFDEAGWYKKATVYNYKKLARIAEEKKIKLVCMQYPGVSIEPLKKIVQGDAGVLFVDNEPAFKEAIRQEGYDAYFIDKIGEPNSLKFGRCTKKGNLLLVENIMQSLMHTLFHTKEHPLQT